MKVEIRKSAIKDLKKIDAKVRNKIYLNTMNIFNISHLNAISFSFFIYPS